MQELSLSGHTLKLDLVIIVDLLSHCLHFDAWMETENAPHAILSLEVNLENGPEELRVRGEVELCNL